MGRYKDAEMLLPTLEPQTRNDWIAYHIRGMILLKTGMRNEAIALFKKGVRTIPFADEVKYFKNALAIANLQVNNFQEAAHDLAMDEEPLTDILRMHIFSEVDRILEAKEAYQRVKECCPSFLVRNKKINALYYRWPSVLNNH